jgi:hypothetical protein
VRLFGVFFRILGLLYFFLDLSTHLTLRPFIVLDFGACRAPLSMRIKLLAKVSAEYSRVRDMPAPVAAAPAAAPTPAAASSTASSSSAAPAPSSSSASASTSSKRTKASSVVITDVQDDTPSPRMGAFDNYSPAVTLFSLNFNKVFVCFVNYIDLFHR